MRYLLCVVPPLAMLLCGRPLHLVISCVLVASAFVTVGVGYVVAIAHALIIVGNTIGNKRHKELLKATRRRETRERY